MAQHDGPPLSGAYPISAWQPGAIVLDELRLHPGEEWGKGPFRLAIGIYDPGTLQRWPASSEDGTVIEDGRALLKLPDEVLP